MNNAPLKRVALAQSSIIPGGGTEAVTAWMIQSLKQAYQVTLITHSQVDVSEFNRYYGTSLDSSEFSLVKVPLPRFLMSTRRLSILKDHLLMRYCKSMRDRFDLFISPGGVMDFGGRSIQYVGLGPDSTLIKVMDNTTAHKSVYIRVKRWFMAACERLSGYSQETARNNVTIAPSVWAGDLINRVFGIPDYKVVYPPVSTFQDQHTPETTWDSRINGFLCVARLVPGKKIENVIAVLNLVRKSGFDISLRIVGRQDDPIYAQTISRICEDNAAWITLDDVLERHELLPLMTQYRYGIHGALDEPFGIAIAEMVKFGCIVFVPNGGGQIEIVESPYLTFSDLEDGASKISAVLKSHPIQSNLLDHLQKHSQSFSVENFCESTQAIVKEIFQK